MSIINDIENLRSLITQPSDPLFDHLTDLVRALEEVDRNKELVPASISPNKVRYILLHTYIIFQFQLNGRSIVTV